MNKKAKWLVYTVLVGLIPVIARLFVWLVIKIDGIAPFVASDFIAFGLVLHIANINEIEHFPSTESSWKTIQNGTSVIFIAVYSVLFAMTIIGGDIVNKKTITWCTFILSFVSFFISYSVYDRLAKVPSN